MSDQQNNSCFDSEKLNQGLELSILRGELAGAKLKIEQLQRENSVLKQDRKLISAGFISRDDALTEIQTNIRVACKGWISDRISAARSIPQKDLLVNLEAEAVKKYGEYKAEQLVEGRIFMEPVEYAAYLLRTQQHPEKES